MRLFGCILYLSAALAAPFKGGSSQLSTKRDFPSPVLGGADADDSDEPNPNQAEQFMNGFLQGHQWIPASQIANSSRSPCPLLNALANHGFLPRNGRQLKISDFENAITAALNLSPNFATNLTVGAFQHLGLLTDNATHDDVVAIDLVALDAHDKTEHDASITRLDIIQGNNLVVQPSYVQNMLDDTVPDSYSFLNTSSLGRTRVRREKESIAVGSPPLMDNEVMFGLALAEAGLVLLFLGLGDDNSQSPDARSIPKGQAQEWFNYERFPLGWMRSQRELDLDGDLAPLVQKVAYWRNYWLQAES